MVPLCIANLLRLYVIVQHWSVTAKTSKYSNYIKSTDIKKMLSNLILWCSHFGTRSGKKSFWPTLILLPYFVHHRLTFTNAAVAAECLPFVRLVLKSELQELINDQ